MVIQEVGTERTQTRLRLKSGSCKQLQRSPTKKKPNSIRCRANSHMRERHRPKTNTGDTGNLLIVFVVVLDMSIYVFFFSIRFIERIIKIKCQDISTKQTCCSKHIHDETICSDKQLLSWFIIGGFGSKHVFFKTAWKRHVFSRRF